MQAFVIPTWIWLNAAILVASGAYVAIRLNRTSRAKTAPAPGRPAYVRAATGRT